MGADRRSKVCRPRWASSAGMVRRSDYTDESESAIFTGDHWGEQGTRHWSHRHTASSRTRTRDNFADGGRCARRWQGYSEVVCGLSRVDANFEEWPTGARRKEQSWNLLGPSSWRVRAVH